MEKRINRFSKNTMLVLALYVAVLIAVAFRTSFFVTVSPIVHDEGYNIAQAYSFFTGAKYLVTNMSILQIGDAFLYPFLWLFVKITGGTQGIVLFSRLSYVFFVAVLSLVWHKLLKPYTKQSYLAGLFYLTFVPMGLQTISYDTAPMLFIFTAIILIVFSIKSQTERSRLTALFFSGIFSALTVYAYPAHIATVFFLVIAYTVYGAKKNGLKTGIKSTVYYIFGGAVIIAAFLIYAISIGVENLFFFNKLFLDFASTHTSGSLSSQLWELINGTILTSIHVLIYPCVASLIFFVIYLFGFKFKVVKYCLPVLIVGFSFLYCAYAGISGATINSLVALNFIFLPFIWTPLMYFYLPKEKREDGRILLLFLWLSGLIGWAVVSFSAMGTNTKSHIGMLPGVICFIIFLTNIYGEIECKKIPQLKNIFACLAVLMFTVCNLFNLYCFPFFVANPITDCTYTVQSGIYKGIRATSETKKAEKLEKFVADAVDENDKTICSGYSHSDIYLYTRLTPLTGSFWCAWVKNDDGIYDWYKSSYYFNCVEKLPDVIVVEKEKAPDFSEDIKNLLNEKYYSFCENDETVIYKIVRDAQQK